MNLNIGDTSENLRKQIAAMKDVHDKKRKYEEEVLNTLKGIEKNTANLTEIVYLIKESGDKQSEVFELLVEMLSIAKESNKEKAESKFRAVMQKATSFGGDIETIQKLIGFGTTIFNMIQNIPT